MTLTITVDGTDVTSLVRLDQIALQMKAYGGEVGAGKLVFDDPTGTATPASPMKEWVATVSDASPTTIAGGYIAERDIIRGPLTAGTQRQVGPVLDDYNAALSDRILMGASARRPAETDYQRIQWLLGTGVLAHLDGAGHVPNTDTVDMEPANYRGQTAYDVLQECAEAANKNFFVYFKSGTGWVLFYDKANATNAAFTSSLSISDDPTDVDSSTVFGPSDIEYMRDPVSVFSSMVVRWRSGWVRETNDDTRDTFRRRDLFRRRTRCRTASAARRWARRQLEKTDEEVQRLSLSVTVPGAKLGELRAGQRILVKLRSRGITAFTYFRIVVATFSPKIGDSGNPTDVLWNVRLTMRDKERLLGGGVGGSGGSGISGGSHGGGGDDDDGGGLDSGEEPDDDPSPPGGGVETGEHVLDDWSRSASTFPEALAAAQTDSTGTAHNINLPAGSDIPGNLLLVAYVTTDADAGGLLLDQFEALGYVTQESYQNTGSTSGAILAIITDGTQNDISVLTSGSETILARVALILGTDGQITADILAGEDPPSISGWVGENELVYVFGFDNTAVLGGPLSGYPNVVSLTSTGTALRVSRGDQVGAVNPGAWTASSSGAQVSATVGIRFQEPEWGTIPRGEGVDTAAPWVGGNRYVNISSGIATVSTDGTHGLIDLGSTATVAMALVSDSPDDPQEQPWGPWADGDASLRYLWKVDPVGDVGDTDPNILEWQIITGGWRGIFRVNLGDGETYVYQSGGDERGIVIGQMSTIEWSDFVPKTIASDTYYMTRVDFRGTQARMKLWLASETEPIEWDIAVPKVDDDSGEDDVGQLYIRVYGNTGMLFTFDTSWAEVGGSASGAVTENLPNGDGVTTTWTILPFLGDVIVWVDGILTAPASYDRVAGNIVFDRAPAFGAYITVQYVPA